MKWVEQVASTGEIRSTYRLLVGHMEGRDNLEAQAVQGNSNEAYLIETE
jgi:hypothetical protein